MLSAPLSLAVLLATLNVAHGDGNFLQPAIDFFVQPITNFVVGQPNPEAKMTVTQIIEYHGYPAETHSVTTEDGYILTFHRIPYGKNGSSASRPPIFVQHGFVCSSVTWLMNAPESNLPYLLADKGYDVWLGNYRGNTYCRNHTTLTVTDPEFWDFSWEEMALIDLPTMVDYALEKNGADKISYVGHSMGTSTVFALLCTKTEYNDKIKAIMALAPVTIVTHMISPLRYLGPDVGMEILKAIKYGEFPILGDIFGSVLCRLSLTSDWCATLLFSIFGPDWSQYNKSRADIYFTWVPSSTSVKLLQHYEQMIVSNKFCRFDYKHLNTKIYNQTSPPDFDLTKVTVPVALFWSDNDWLTVPKDVETLLNKLPNIVLDHKINYKGFSHSDFLIGKDVRNLAYEPVMDALQRYAP